MDSSPTAVCVIAESFPCLIHALAERHHGDCLLTMSRECDIPYTTLWRWEHGMPVTYNYFLVQRLCAFYGLPTAEVWTVIQRDTEARRLGGRIPLPDLTNRRRGPRRR